MGAGVGSMSTVGAGTHVLGNSGSSTAITSGLITAKAARVQDQLLSSKNRFAEAADAFAMEVGKEIRLLHASLEEARWDAVSTRKHEQSVMAKVAELRLLLEQQGPQATAVRNLLAKGARERDEALVWIERLETVLQSETAQHEATEKVDAASVVVATACQDTIQQLRQQSEGMTSFPNLSFSCVLIVFT